MKTILVATDFSPSARNAANYAADLARALNANLLLLHVYQLPLFLLPVPLPDILDERMEYAQAQISNIQMELMLRTESKIVIETETRIGTFFEELKAVCERVKPCYVIMVSQGTSAIEHLIFGSHTVYAMEHLTWPLITVPSNGTFSSVKKIALACDFNTEIDKISIGQIKQLVTDFNAQLDILNTAAADVYNSEIVFQSGLIREMLAPIKANFFFITNADADEGIMDFVDKENIELLIVLTKRHSLIDKLIHKRHLKQLILHCHTPVMAVHLNHY